MESTDARRAFPCFDEPAFKATFEVTLVIDDHLAAYSNSPIVDETPEPGGRKRVHFGPTMVMSTYLVAFVVGPLGHTDPVDVDGVPLRVVHPLGKGHLTEFALEVGAHALRFFTEYFGIPYPGDKVDMVAIPDFAAGAMENLGCITYRESALLVDPATAARVELERIADVVCHEMAHMWFGDLVTMKWWNGIWLNEAFATFMEVLAVDAFRPDWQRWVSFGVEREAAMAVDGLHATRARSSSRWAGPRRPRACSTSSRTRRAAASCACWSSSSARTCSARASTTTSSPTPTATPRPATCGTRSSARAAGRCPASWTPGSTRVATRW